MFTNTVPVLYYSPSIMNQIYANVNNGIINSETYSKKSSFGTSIKVLIDNLFIPVKGETSMDYEQSREKTINKTHDDLSRTTEIVKAIQTNELNINALSSDNLLKVATLLDGDFKLEIKRSLLDNSNLIHITYSLNEYLVHGVTSIDNWTSKSLINQIIQHGRLTASALVFPLSIQKNLIEAKFACIFLL